MTSLRALSFTAALSVLSGEARAAPEQSGVFKRPANPDNIELVQKIHQSIVQTGAPKEAGEMKAYTQGVSKAGGKEYRMVPIPGGSFLMGSPATEKDRMEDEGPQVKMKIEPFWMGACEVTWDLYMPFMLTAESRYYDGAKRNPKPGGEVVDAVSSPTSPYADMTFGMGQEGYPAISMTHHAALKFCEWLSAQTGHFYRLPTEAEWEYAARAGTTTAWSFGDDASQLGDYAWFEDNSAESNLNTTHPVGKKKPNPWGLFDIYGNVTEWTMDQYDQGWFATLTKQGEAAHSFNKPVKLYPRSVRGGSYDDPAKSCRSAARRGSRKEWRVDPNLPPSFWYLDSAQFVGFRIVRPLKVPTAEEMHEIWNMGSVGEGK